MNDNRKSLYFMPFLDIQETIECENIRLLKNTGNYEDQLPNILKENGGIFVELIDSFKSGDYFNNSIRDKIYNSIEIIKFSYYAMNMPINGIYPGFLSDSTFNIYTIIEGIKDTSYEHKITITNGVNDFLMSLDNYYQHTYILGSMTTVSISQNCMFYFKKIYNKCINDENKISIIKLFNKCLRVTDLNDCFDKVIFARVSIEALINSEEVNDTKKNYVESFVDKSNTFIQSHKELDLEIKNFYQNQVLINNGLIKSKENLNNYLKSLTDARHSLVHENKINSDFRSIEVYITWFPLFFFLSFFEEKLTKEDTPRFIFFLKLLQLDISKWKTKRSNIEMSCLETYSQYSKYLSIALQKDNTKDIKDLIKGLIKGFHNSFDN